MAIVETAVALCAVGAEKTVSNEIKKLGLTVCDGGFGRVRFRTDVPGLYRALLGLRAADRVLLETAFYEALDFDALFEGVRAVPWEAYIPRGMGLRVAKVRTNRSALGAETSIQAVVHKAAAERLCKKWRIDRLPELAAETRKGPGRGSFNQNIRGIPRGNPQCTDEAELRIYIEKNQVSVLLDLSGEPLFRRGYRTRGGTAPIRETTAASIILHSGWRRKFSLYDPFCGSGTIAIEAAMYAWDIAPGLGRQFALEKLLLADVNTGRAVRDELLKKIDFTRPVRIGGSDSDASVITAARSNMERLLSMVMRETSNSENSGQASVPAFDVLPMEEAKEPREFSGSPGFIITNPPYGRRLGDAESSEKTYEEMGSLIRNFPGWKLVLITDHPGFESFFGRKADSCREITNGAIRSYLYQYEAL